MSIYKKFLVKGTPRYLKDGKFAKRQDVPQPVVDRLESEDEVNFGDAYLTPKECVFCGAYTSLTRMVNLQTVYLCDQHYYDKTVGEVAQRIRELNTVST